MTGIAGTGSSVAPRTSGGANAAAWTRPPGRGQDWARPSVGGLIAASVVIHVSDVAGRDADCSRVDTDDEDHNARLDAGPPRAALNRDAGFQSSSDPAVFLPQPKPGWPRSTRTHTNAWHRQSWHNGLQFFGVEWLPAPLVFGHFSCRCSSDGR